MSKKKNFQLYSVTALFAAASIFAMSQVNLMTKAAFGDWAEYSVTRENKTIPLMGFRTRSTGERSV